MTTRNRTLRLAAISDRRSVAELAADANIQPAVVLRLLNDKDIDGESASRLAAVLGLRFRLVLNCAGVKL